MSTTTDDDERVPAIDEGDSVCVTNGASASSSTDSDDDEQESPMGYMPLSQDPDLDDENVDNDCLDFASGSDILTDGTNRTDEVTEQTRHPLSPEDCVCTPASRLEESEFVLLFTRELLSLMCGW